MFFEPFVQIGLQLLQAAIEVSCEMLRCRTPWLIPTPYLLWSRERTAFWRWIRKSSLNASPIIRDAFRYACAGNSVSPQEP